MKFGTNFNLARMKILVRYIFHTMHTYNSLKTCLKSAVLVFTGYRVSVWEDGIVRNMGGSDGHSSV